ncbi:MAG: pyroglutamyl-peptidase I [Candidatus Diapherotrites archaeon]|nr:pyroglutamyl-peptidase I [Candidatus Diapherotrites archaeon]
MKRVLITGFDKFGNNTTNSSGDIARTFNGKKNEKYEVRGVMLPTVYNTAVQRLKEEIDSYNPDVVMCLGLFGGRPNITVERVAINVTDEDMADNEGNIIQNEPILENGETAVFSTLPVTNIVKTLRENGIPAAVSNTAGTFVCNHIFYNLITYLKSKGKNIPAGFIHVPFLPEEVAKNDEYVKKMPSMPLDLSLKAIELAVEETVKD